MLQMAALHSPFYGADMNFISLIKKIEKCNYPPLPSDHYSEEVIPLIQRHPIAIENVQFADAHESRHSSYSCEIWWHPASSATQRRGPTSPTSTKWPKTCTPGPTPQVKRHDRSLRRMQREADATRAGGCPRLVPSRVDVQAINRVAHTR